MFSLKTRKLCCIFVVTRGKLPFTIRRKMNFKKHISLLVLLVSLLVVGCQKQTIVPDSELFDDASTGVMDKLNAPTPATDGIGYINDDDCDCPDEDDDDEGNGSGKNLILHDQRK